MINKVVFWDDKIKYDDISRWECSSYLQPHLKLPNDPVPLSPRIDGHDSRSPLKEKEKE